MNKLRTCGLVLRFELVENTKVVRFQDEYYREGSIFVFFLVAINNNV